MTHIVYQKYCLAKWKIRLYPTVSLEKGRHMILPFIFGFHLVGRHTIFNLDYIFFHNSKYNLICNSQSINNVFYVNPRNIKILTVNRLTFNMQKKSSLEVEITIFDEYLANSIFKF